MVKKCPFCGKILEPYKISGHIYRCPEIKDKNITKDEIKYQYLLCNYGKITIDNIIEDYKNLFSLPMLKEKYNIDSKSVVFLLDFLKISKRNISDSCKLISSIKHKETCLRKYGVTNVSKVKEVKLKKSKTSLEHYGVDNIWKTKDYYEKHSHKRFETMSKNNIFDSNLEKRVLNMLEELNLSFIRQFRFKGYNHPYDFKFNDSNIILEVNGNYWHANPNFYKANDIVPLPKNKIEAKKIWERDKKYIDYAIKKGYFVIIIWEDKINLLNDSELKKYIVELIKNIKNGK